LEFYPLSNSLPARERGLRSEIGMYFYNQIKVNISLKYSNEKPL